MPCSGPLHFSNIADYIYDFCPLTGLDVGLSILVCDVEHTSLHLICAAASLCCACLVSVQVSAPYVIAKVAFEDIPVFGVCRLACHGSSLYLLVLVLFDDSAAIQWCQFCESLSRSLWNI